MTRGSTARAAASICALSELAASVPEDMRLPFIGLVSTTVRHYTALPGSMDSLAQGFRMT